MQTNNRLTNLIPQNMQSIIFKNISLVSLVAIAAACGNKGPAGPAGPPPVSVAVQEVKKGDATYYAEYPAIVRALNEVELRPQVSGYITAIHFREGERVKKGQKLYSIDPQQSEGAYQQALANLKVQETNLLKAKQDVERYRKLNESDAIAKQQVDYAEAAYEAAQKQVDAAKAVVSSVQTNVRYTTITAPFDGTIGISAVRLGTSVSPGTTLLNTISTDDPIGVDITIDQKEIYHFTELAQKSNPKDSVFRLAFGGDVYPYPGHISVVDRAVDAQTGSLRVRLTFENPEHRLRSGMSATLRLLSKADQAVIIPFKAVTEQLGEFFVYVADSSKVTQRKVTLGTQVGRDIIIKQGLSTGEVIVTEGVQNLREGSAINIAQTNNGQSSGASAAARN
ncbi:efflux RND transporter periplasmic adaptor subunit [Chryseolinea sp. T2]|uniref:efflux RND transporter periplasmic adaptor subunit n=1 Tax=Chryseolinea sp. T2 TaxID=3129255 RepID=UPI0030777309